MERETGIEPATFSLGNRPSIENKEHSVSGHLVLAIEIAENLKFSTLGIRMEHKWSTGASRIRGNNSKRSIPAAPVPSMPGLDALPLFPFWWSERTKKATSLCEHLHVDSRVLLSVLSKTAVIPPAHVGKFKKIEAGDYSPQFPLKHMSKDLNLVMAAAAPLMLYCPWQALRNGCLPQMIASKGDLDLSAIAPYIVGLTGPQSVVLPKEGSPSVLQDLQGSP